MNSGGKLSRMPNQPATTIRGVRVPDDLWAEAKEVAAAEGFAGVSAMIRDCLELRVAAYRKRQAEDVGNASDDVGMPTNDPPETPNLA